MKKKPIYLDYAAATPTDPRVIKTMVDCMSIEGSFGNPHAKDHVYGWEAAEAVEQARDEVASLIGVSPLEITFTSGATESNNLAIFGLAMALKKQGDKRRHIITTKIEHKAILEACALLEEQGYRVTYLTPHRDGIVDVDLLKTVFDEDTFLVTIAQANSVLGSVCDVHALAAYTKEQGAFFHTDCAQSAGYIKTDFDNSDVSMATLTSEKVCGPKGVGALYVQRSQNVPLTAQIYGGGQEKGLRGGTVATHAVAGMGRAFAILQKEGAADAKRMNELRDRLIDGILKIDGAVINGSPEHHVPGILSVSFEGINGRLLLPTLNGIAASAGSACASADLKPSYILTAIGHSDELARASIRLSLGRFTTAEEIDLAIKELQQKIPALKIKKS
ncbi:MAG: aminotransferase class V-fold PLP-dependent enzyme [Succinivibrio sp.]|nr:aminotransferase class V-fold PLP-dependent enzyme [Succinivibrio sp.]